MNLDQHLELPAPDCPKCGEKDCLPLAYGYPGPEMREAAKRQRVVLAGCVIRDNTHECRFCSHRFNSAGS